MLFSDVVMGFNIIFKMCFDRKVNMYLFFLLLLRDFKVIKLIYKCICEF